ncbi:unnamed protein product [Strongylus vulgaris]|uniref:Calx-beta domain-containing protein n=1 Tax=Strongylus vulgaris TaxID=40348 RepID=A0A3P7JFZ7_STRVU|nr:unnamed protein product [Strongylus vulgaris]
MERCVLQRLIGELPKPPLDFVRSLSRDVSRTYPSLSLEDQAKILAYRLNRNAAHDRLYYRIRAARMIAAGLKRSSFEREVEDTLMKHSGVTTEDGRRKPRVEFSASVYAIEPTDKRVVLTIVRHGPCANEITVNYCTQSGVAKKNLHFLPKSESIKMAPDERTRDIDVTLVDGAEWRPNHTFYVNLKIQVL